MYKLVLIEDTEDKPIIHHIVSLENLEAEQILSLVKNFPDGKMQNLRTGSSEGISSLGEKKRAELTIVVAFLR